MRSDARTALLLFSAGGATPKAVPLGLVARLEDIPSERIEMSGDTPVVQYRDRLMPLVPLSPGWARGEPGTRQAVLVFDDRDRAMGLMVDAILDVVEERLAVQAGHGRPGYLGTAVVAGRATDVVDCGWWLRRAAADWFGDAGPGSGGPAARRGGAAEAKTRVLVVEDSAFFRHLVVPALAAAGYAVTAVDTGAQALRLREDGALFDAIVSDIEMPELDGLGLVRAVRAGGGPWADLPMIALTSRVEPEAVERGRAAGFTDYVGKFDRDSLLASLGGCLEAHRAAAAAAAPSAAMLG